MEGKGARRGREACECRKGLRGVRWGYGWRGLSHSGGGLLGAEGLGGPVPVPVAGRRVPFTPLERLPPCSRILGLQGRKSVCEVV